MESLFESRPEIARVSGRVRFVQATPEVTSEPVIRPDSELDGGGLGYQTVLHDQGVYRMWYQALPRSWDGSNVEGVGYAESDDGVTWRKPDLNSSSKGKLSGNLCDLSLHSPSVFIDPDSPSSHRYRAVGYGRSSQLGGASDSPVHGFYTAHSADGISWEIDQTEPQWDSADVVSAFYHPGRKQAIASVKMRLVRNGKFKRAIYNAAYDRGQWSAAFPALIPDEFDEVGAISRGCASADYYSMGMAAGGREALIGFISQFRHEGPLSKNGYGVFGTADISLAFQQDRSGGWIHAPGRPDFVSHDSAEWTRGGIFSPGSVVEAGDENRFYFAGATRSHGWYLDDAMKIVEERKAELLKSGHSAIGFASWPKGRLFGFRADPEGWIDLNLDPMEGPQELRLNYSTSVGGSVRVELYSMDPPREWQNPEHPADGYGLADAIPLTGDGFETVAAWQSGTVINPVAGKRWLARIHLDSASVHEFGLQPA